MRVSRKAKYISLAIHLCFLSLAVALMVVASFYDLKISVTLSDATSFFGAFFSVIGELPAYLIIPIACVIFFYGNFYSSKKSVRIIEKLGIITLCYAGFMIWFMFATLINEVSMRLQFAIVYSAIFTAIFLLIGRLIKREEMVRLAKFASFAVTVMAITFVVIWAMKLGWGRMRFRDMESTGDFSGFTKWYTVNGYKKGDFTSFPSGHTSSAVNIFVVTILFDIYPKIKKYKPFAILACVIFCILTALSRIVFRAHFLSDVVAGAAISYAVYYAAKVIFFKCGEYEFIANKKKVEDSVENGN